MNRGRPSTIINPLSDRTGLRSGTMSFPADPRANAEANTTVFSNPNPNKRKRADSSIEDLEPFGSDPFDDTFEAIDLVDKEEFPPTEAPKKKNCVRLKNVTCIVCMDSCTDLTVTHCGKHHLSPFPTSILTPSQATSTVPIASRPPSA